MWLGTVSQDKLQIFRNRQDLEGEINERCKSQNIRPRKTEAGNRNLYFFTISTFQSVRLY